MSFEIPRSTPLVTMRKSPLHVLTRGALFLAAGQSGGSVTLPPGIIGDSLRFYAYAATFPLPSFRWNLQMIGDPADDWGRKSFTIRYWWRAGATEVPGAPFSASIWSVFRILFASTFFIQHNENVRAIDSPPTDPEDPYFGATIAHIPTIRFGVKPGASFETVELHFSQSPNTSGGLTTGLPTGGIIGPLIEMAEDTWHRIVVWYDADALEIGIQLDDLTPETTTLTGPIPAGATQGLQGGELTPFNNFDFGLDELGLWHDYVWTGPERTADLNAGAGTGWPDVLSTISARPMAYFRFEDPEDNFPEGMANVAE